MTDTASASRAPESAHPDQIAELAGPIATESGCAIYDVQWRGGTLVVLATAAGGDAIGVDGLTQLSRKLSAALDATDAIDGRYVLEVSSPGLERSLRRPEHFVGAVGERIVIRTSTAPRRRIVGEVLEADGSGVTVRIEEMSGDSQGHPKAPAAELGQAMVVSFDNIAKARTTFEWGPQTRNNPGSGRSGQSTSGRKPR